MSDKPWYAGPDALDGPYTEITDKYLIERDEIGAIVMINDREEFLRNWPQVKRENLATFGMEY